MKLDVTQHFRQMKPKMSARMNTTLLVVWCSASTSKSFHYYYSLPKSNHYCCYNQVKRTRSQIQWYSMLVMWFHWWGSAPQRMCATIYKWLKCIFRRCNTPLFLPISFSISLSCLQHGSMSHIINFISNAWAKIALRVTFTLCLYVENFALSMWMCWEINP